MSVAPQAFQTGGQGPVERTYEGRDQEDCRRQMSAESPIFQGMVPNVLSVERIDRRFRPDVTVMVVRWQAPPWNGPGVRLVGTQPEVIWSTVAEAKHAIKELRLVKRDFTASKREATGNATAARRRESSSDAKARAAAPYVYEAEQWERGILAVDEVIRDLDRWLLYNPK